MKATGIYLAIAFGIPIDILFYLANQRSSLLLAILGLLLIVISCFYKKGMSNLLLFVFLLPSQRLIAFPDSSISLLNVIIFLSIVIFTANKRSINLKASTLYLWLCPAAYAALTYIFSESIYDFIVGTKLFFLLIYIWHFASLERYKASFSIVGEAYIAGCIVACIMAMIEYNLGQRLSGGDNSDANIFAAYISFALSCIAVLLISGRSRPLIGVPIAIALIIFGLLTQSRSFLLCLGIIVGFSGAELFLSNRNGVKALLSAAIFLVASTMLGLLLASQYQNLVDPAIERLINPRGGDVSGGRLLLWEIYIDYLLSGYQTLFFGVGSENAMEVVGVDQVSHNALLELFIGWGVIGGMIVLMVLAHFSYKVYAKNSKVKIARMKIIGLLPFFSLTAASFTGHSVLSIGFVVSLFISILAYSSPAIINKSLNRQPFKYDQ